MPITVRCPNCQSKLTAPDAAAGRRVKCPKCETKIPVPAAEGSGTAPAIAEPVAEAPPPLPPPAPAEAASASPFDFSSPEPGPAAATSPPPPASAAPAFDFGAATEAGAGKPPPRESARKPARPVEDDDDDDDEDGDEPPRRGRRRPPPPREPEGKKSNKTLVIILVAAGLFFLTCCVGGPIGVYFFLKSKAEQVQQDIQRELDRAAREAKNREMNPPPEAGNDKAPPGWTEYAAIDGTFKGYFPGPVQEETVEPVKLKNVKSPVQAKMYRSQSADESVIVIVRVLRFDDSANPAFRTTLMRTQKSEMLDGDNATQKSESQRPVTWLGQPVTETIHGLRGPKSANGKVVVRDAIVGDVGYIATIKSKDGRPGPEIESGFFDTFEATAK
jgi:hypothetical protein